MTRLVLFTLFFVSQLRTLDTTSVSFCKKKPVLITFFCFEVNKALNHEWRARAANYHYPAFYHGCEIQLLFATKSNVSLVKTG